MMIGDCYAEDVRERGTIEVNNFGIQKINNILHVLN